MRIFKGLKKESSKVSKLTLTRYDESKNFVRIFKHSALNILMMMMEVTFIFSLLFFRQLRFAVQLGSGKPAAAKRLLNQPNHDYRHQRGGPLGSYTQPGGHWGLWIRLWWRKLIFQTFRAISYQGLGGWVPSFLFFKTWCDWIQNIFTSLLTTSKTGSFFL